jgi:hypothetical protein
LNWGKGRERGKEGRGEKERELRLKDKIWAGEMYYCLA